VVAPTVIAPTKTPTTVPAPVATQAPIVAPSAGDGGLAGGDGSLWALGLLSIAAVFGVAWLAVLRRLRSSRPR
jgi:hypothetical protein